MLGFVGWWWSAEWVLKSRDEVDMQLSLDGRLKRPSLWCWDDLCVSAGRLTPPWWPQGRLVTGYRPASLKHTATTTETWAAVLNYLFSPQPHSSAPSSLLIYRSFSYLLFLDSTTPHKATPYRPLQIVSSICNVRRIYYSVLSVFIFV